MTQSFELLSRVPGTQTSPSVERVKRLEHIIGDPEMALEDKRALLASWASDMNAVPHLPWLRQLPDGSIVKLADILRALKALDGPDAISPAERLSFGPKRSNKKKPSLRNLFWLRPIARDGDDDDDPPPCPACPGVRPSGRGGPAFAYPDPVAA